MALPNDNVSMALYCDFENVALGVRDAKYSKFDIMPVLERLLLKGSIVVKKAYCDWDRYKEFKAQMHEASFELIEIPHVRQSGKNSADIRMVVDALDLCYTKAHVNTFVIISGDSDFSPLVSKLRENAKYVIGVGVKNSTSDLLIANCDEFIFIDDLVRESRRASAKREVRHATPAVAAPSATANADEQLRKHDVEVRKSRAVEMAAETFEALMAERGDSGKIWASTLKQAIKRRKPDFNENYFGFRTFGNLLEEAQSRGLIDIGRDDKSGVYVYRSPSSGNEAIMAESSTLTEELPRSNGRSRRKQPVRDTAVYSIPVDSETPEVASEIMSVQPTETADAKPEGKPRRTRGGRKPAKEQAASQAHAATAVVEIIAPPVLSTPLPQDEPAASPVRKPARSPRPAKPKAATVPE